MPPPAIQDVLDAEEVPDFGCPVTVEEVAEDLRTVSLSELVDRLEELCSELPFALTEAERGFAESAFDDAALVQLTLVVWNRGDAAASNVQLSPPNDWTLVENVDGVRLSPGQREAYVVVTSASVKLSNQVVADSSQLTFDAAAGPPPRWALATSLALAVAVWALVLIWAHLTGRDASNS